MNEKIEFKNTIEYKILFIRYMAPLVMTLICLLCVIIINIRFIILEIPLSEKALITLVILNFSFLLFYLPVPLYIILNPYLKMRKIRKSYDKYEVIAINLPDGYEKFGILVRFFLTFDSSNQKNVEVRTNWYRVFSLYGNASLPSHEVVRVLIGYNPEKEDVIFLEKL